LSYLTIPPDLVAEVVSPNDTADELSEKIEKYLRAGVPLVWVVYPETRLVEIHRQDGSVAKLHESAELSGESIVPGFRCQVSDLFPTMAQRS
jgi:Uma2 family endonuclease